MTTSGLAANMTASKNKGFEQSDLRPVAFVAISPDVIAIHPSNPAKNLKEFIANAKANSFTYGSAGVGTGPQIGAEYFFKEVAKVKYVHVPFQGGAAGDHRDARQSRRCAGSDAAAGDAAHPERRVARHRRRQRQAQFGDPGCADLRRDGIPQCRIPASWVAFFAPAKTPDAVVEKLNAEINAVMKEPDSLDKIAKAGFDPLVKSVAEANDYYKSEVESWGKMVNAIGFSN